MLNIFKKNPKNIRDIAVETLSSMVQEYDKWYAEHGLYLPPDYESDPTGWTEVLHKISRAFTLMNDNNHERGELWDESDFEKREELREEIRGGFFLFGKYLYWLNDQIK